MFATLIPVDSEAIRAVSYDGYTLAVQFHSSDTIYDHPNVPSMGAYYNCHIRGRYK